MPIDEAGLISVYDTFVCQGGIRDGWGWQSDVILESYLFEKCIKIQQVVWGSGDGSLDRTGETVVCCDTQ